MTSNDTGVRPMADDVEAIRQLKARYFRGVDTRDWELLRSVFTEDAEIGPMESGVPAHVIALQPPAPGHAPSNTSVGAFMARIEPFLVGVLTVHHGHQPEITFTADGEADGIWPMEDVLVWPKDGYRFRGAGYYWERYRKVDGEWRIASVRLTRLYAYTETFEPELA